MKLVPELADLLIGPDGETLRHISNSSGATVRVANDRDAHDLQACSVRATAARGLPPGAAAVSGRSAGVAGRSGVGRARDLVHAFCTRRFMHGSEFAAEMLRAMMSRPQFKLGGRDVRGRVHQRMVGGGFEFASRSA